MCKFNFIAFLKSFVLLIALALSWLFPALQPLPDPLERPDGRCVRTTAEWEAKRGDVTALLEEYVYGARPAYDLERYELLSESYDDDVAPNAVTQMWKLFYGDGRSFTLRLTYPDAPGAYPTIMRYESLMDFRFPIEAEAVGQEKYCVAAINYMEMFPDVGEPGLEHMHEAKAIMAWACGASLALDFLETQAVADTAHVLITGHSRTGKAALCATAFDERFALCVPNSSGAAGASGLRKFDDKGSQGIDIAIHEPTWVSDRLADYADCVNKLPIDMNFARALIAPRPILCTESLDGGGSLWAGPRSTVKMWKSADRVYALYGAEENNLIHFRPGEHDQTAEDYRRMMEFADHYFYGTPLDVLK